MQTGTFLLVVLFRLMSVFFLDLDTTPPGDDDPLKEDSKRGNYPIVLMKQTEHLLCVTETTEEVDGSSVMENGTKTLPRWVPWSNDVCF